MTKTITRAIGMTVMLAALLVLSVCTIPVHADTKVSDWDCLPSGSEYLNPSNITLSSSAGVFTITTTHLFRVKPATTYTFYYKRDLDATIDEMSVKGYLYDKTGEETLTPVKNAYDVSGTSYDSGFTVQTLSGTCYLTFSVTLETQAFDASAYDAKLAFLEGAYDAAIGTSPTTIASYLYEGAANDYAPVLSGETGIYYTSYDDPVTVTKVRSSLRAIDDMDGDITNRITIQEDHYTSVTEKVPGAYAVVFAVTDAAGNTATLTMSIVVRDYLAPTISGANTFASSASNPLYEADIRATLIASDNVDGDVTSSIAVLSDGYTGHEKVQGTYDIVYEVMDEAENQATFAVSVAVSDQEAPVISGPSSVTQSNKATNTVQYYKNLMTATDNGTNVTSSITIIQDNYTANIGRIGSWTITFRVTDAAGNVGEKVLTVKITDQVAPIFFVDSTLVILEARQNGLTVGQMISSLKTIGVLAHEGAVTVARDDYTGHEQVAGTYEVVLAQAGQEVSLAVQVVNGYDMALQAKPRFARQTASLVKELVSAFLSVFRS